MRISDYLTMHKDSSNIAIIHGDNNITYQKLYEKSLELSYAVATHECNNVALFLPNGIDYVIGYFSVLFSNKTIVPINIQTGQADICRALEFCDVSLVVTNSKSISIINQIKEQYNLSFNAICVDTAPTVLPPVHITNDSDPALIIATSGSTQNPKYVMLTHANLHSNITGIISGFKHKQSDRPLIMMPMTTAYVNTAQLLHYIYHGLTFVIMDTIFTASNFTKIIQKELITHTCAVPTIVYLLLKSTSDFSIIRSLQYINIGGDGMSKKLLDTAMLCCPWVTFTQGYGLTEMSPVVSQVAVEDYHKKRYSVGKALAGVQIAIKNNNEECQTMEPGEILVCGDNIMAGYYKNEDATNKAIVNGWLHTGDIGYLDEDGYLYVKGRMKNIIITSGNNVSPEEVEEVLNQHPCVAGAYVYSQDDPRLGQRVLADIISDDEINEVELVNFCRKHLTEYKIPHKFNRVQNITRTMSGKVKRS